MRSWLESGRGIEVASIEEPRLSPGEVRVRIEASSGPLERAPRSVRRPFGDPPPRALGAQGAGVVVEEHEGLERRVLGERVAIGPWIGCGRCLECTQDRALRCSLGQLLGRDASGTLAERCVVPVRALVPLPPALSSLDAVASLPPLAAAAELCEALGVGHGTRLLVRNAERGLENAILREALARGARAIAELRSSAGRAEVSDLSLLDAFVHGSAPPVTQVRRTLGRTGLDLLVCAEEGLDAELAEVLAAGGTVLSSDASALDLDAILGRWGRVVAPSLPGTRALWRAADRLAGAGAARRPGAVLPFERPEELLRWARRPDRIGTAVVAVSPGDA